LGATLQQLFARAQQAGSFNAQIVPVEISDRSGTVVFDRDEHNRPGTTLEALARLKPLSQGRHITAGNAPGLNDAAAAVVLANADRASREGMKPVVAWSRMASRRSSRACSAWADSRGQAGAPARGVGRRNGRPRRDQ